MEALLRALYEIVSREVGMQGKLSMLTEIGLCSSNDETLKATETVREELVELEEILK